MLKKIILFSLPLAASSILQLLFNAADVVVIGRFVGSTALAAVGSNGALINCWSTSSSAFRWVPMSWPPAALVPKMNAASRIRSRRR